MNCFGGSYDGSSISTNNYKYNRPCKFGGPRCPEFKILKLGMDIPPAHIFDLTISPKFYKHFMMKSTNMRSEMKGAGKYINGKVPRLASVLNWSRGPHLWRGFTHGQTITAKFPIRVRTDQETSMAMKWGEGVDTERGPGGV